MKKPEEIAKALHLCYNPPSSCGDCPYDDCEDCVATVAKDAEECIMALVDKIPRWIPVEEKLPEDGQAVFVVFAGRWCMMGWRSQGEWYTRPTITQMGVTHWMPLPEAPKEE